VKNDENREGGMK